MAGIFIRWLVNTFVLIIVVSTVPGIYVDRWETVAVAALTLGLLNAFLRPVVIFLTFPLQIFSLGFFTLVTNGLMFYLVSKLVEGFYVVSFWHAFFGALLFSVISFLLNLFINPDGRISVKVYQQHPTKSSRRKNVIDVEGSSDDDDDQGPNRIKNI